MRRIVSIEEIGGRNRRAAVAGTPARTGRSRVRVTMEDGESFIVTSLKSGRLGLEEGKELPEEIYAEIMQSLRTACMQRCGMLLGSRDYSEQRMRDKLYEAGYPLSIVEESLGKLQKAGYLDDRRLAQSYVRSHIQDRSRLRIFRDLAGKGISERDIEEAFAKVAEENDLEEVQRQQIRRLLQKRGFDFEEASYEERQKAMAFLHRKGYPSDLIRRATGGFEEY